MRSRFIISCLILCWFAIERDVQATALEFSINNDGQIVSPHWAAVAAKVSLDDIELVLKVKRRQEDAVAVRAPDTTAFGNISVLLRTLSAAGYEKVTLIAFSEPANSREAAVRLRLPSNSTAEPIVVSAARSGQYFLGTERTPSPIDRVVGTLRVLARQKEFGVGTPVFIRGDKLSTFGSLMDIMRSVIEVGFTPFCVVTSN